MTTLQRQAKALGDPTRHAIFTFIAGATHKVTVSELTEHLGLHHNAIRLHLGKLLDADLVTETRVTRAGPGRPHRAFQLSPAAEARWGAVTPYERLAVLLTEMIDTGDSALDVGWRAGKRYRTETGATDDVINDLIHTMARLGFQPAVEQTPERLDIVLRTCPFASAAVASSEVVCTLHLGLARGIADNSEAVVSDLVANDPRVAGCLLRVQMSPRSSAL